MARHLAPFASLLFSALAMVPSMAHLMELPNKIQLSRADYFVAQQLYRGWALVGVVVTAALLSTAALAFVVRRERGAFLWALVAVLGILATQVVFWAFTFPMNRVTQSWQALPENWTAIRRQWEYSHAASAVLNLVAFLAVIVSVLKARAVSDT